MMRIIVDYERCHSNANCIDECPEVFTLDGEYKAEVHCEDPSEDLRDKVEFAALCCPRSAITVITEDR